VYAKRYYNAHHHPLVFNVDDWVWLRLLNRHTRSLEPGTRGKLGPRYAGPFQITERVGKVAYRLRLPSGARINDVFHVGVLKPFHGTPPATTPALPPIQHGRLLQQPEKCCRFGEFLLGTLPQPILSSLYSITLHKGPYNIKNYIHTPTLPLKMG